MKNLVFLFLALGCFVCPTAQAVEVGDVFNSDGTFTTNQVSGKLPVGLLYYIPTDRSYGLVMALNQPLDKTKSEAYDYCYNYTTLGFGIGSWRMPNIQEMMPLMKESINGTVINNFSNINSKLAKISVGEQLKSGNYWTISYNTNKTSNDFVIALDTGVMPWNRYSSYPTLTNDAQQNHIRCIRKVTLSAGM